MNVRFVVLFLAGFVVGSVSALFAHNDYTGCSHVLVRTYAGDRQIAVSGGGVFERWESVRKELDFVRNVTIPSLQPAHDEPLHVVVELSECELW